MTADKYQYRSLRSTSTQQAIPFKDYIFMFITFGALSILFLALFFRALDIRLDRQHQMLCESAKISGNTEVLNCD